MTPLSRLSLGQRLGALLMVFAFLGSTTMYALGLAAPYIVDQFVFRLPTPVTLEPTPTQFIPPGAIIPPTETPLPSPTATATVAGTPTLEVPRVEQLEPTPTQLNPNAPP